jgi:hypothetical protein
MALSISCLRVTFDTAADNDNAFCVYQLDKVLILKEAMRRLYYFNTVDRNDESKVVILTLDENKSKCSAMITHKQN